MNNRKTKSTLYLGQVLPRHHRAHSQIPSRYLQVALFTLCAHQPCSIRVQPVFRVARCDGFLSLRGADSPRGRPADPGCAEKKIERGAALIDRGQGGVLSFRQAIGRQTSAAQWW